MTKPKIEDKWNERMMIERSANKVGSCLRSVSKYVLWEVFNDRTSNTHFQTVIIE